MNAYVVDNLPGLGDPGRSPKGSRNLTDAPDRIRFDAFEAELGRDV
jgi:hypothetical protein